MHRIPMNWLIIFFHLKKKYNRELLLLMPKNGLDFYLFVERVSFDESALYEVTNEEIKSMRTYLPNHIINKCVCILNDKIATKIRSVNFLTIVNPGLMFEFKNDDIQIIQMENGLYVLLKYVYLTQLVYAISSVEFSGEEKYYISKFVEIRYPTATVEHNVPQISAELLDVRFSGFLVIAFAIDIID